MPYAADTASIFSSNTVSSVGGSKSIFPRGATFSLDTFSVRFPPRVRLPAIVGSLLTGAAAFDPKPYIRTFEHALTRLAVLSDEREAHEHELGSAVQRAEAQHRQHCASLQQKLDQALESFNQLESRIDSSLDGPQASGASREAGGAVALHIGGSLEELDRQKQHAEDAKFLLECWQNVRDRGDLSLLDGLRRLGNDEGKVKCARIAKQLLTISNRLDPNAANKVNGRKVAANGVNGVNGSKPHRTGHDETTELIEKFLERLETDLLEQFDEAKRQHSDEGMRECATVLYDFGEGASVIGRFVNQHDFFLDRGHMTGDDDLADQDAWDVLADPDTELPGVDGGLQALIDEVKLVLEEESFSIKKIFPFHELVLVRFIQRIFQQSIQQKLELVLEKARSVSPLAFLRTLHSSRSYMSSMVEDLKIHGLTEHPEIASVQASTALDQQLEELFVPQLAGSAYIESERKSLEELYGSLLYKFSLYHVCTSTIRRIMLTPSVATKENSNHISRRSDTT
ncbi:hypothetical protein MRB53_042028 [Persea americana]|nr:hypothetical protein MRB53_042028 [Persea americana]